MISKKLWQMICDPSFAPLQKRKLWSFSPNLKSVGGKDLPSAVKCPDNSIIACLTFFAFPEEGWISLRTTDIIERLNEEFKCRTKPMEIVAVEQACYTLLAFISIKMELHWRSNPIEKVRKNLPFFKELVNNNFTQLN